MMKSLYIGIVAVVVIAYLCVENTRLESTIVALKAEHATEIASANTAAAKRVLDANNRADVVYMQLYDTEKQLKQLTERKRDAITKNTTGSACFAAPLVRVLNDTGNQGDGSTRLPTPPGIADADDGAFATDTDVAQWINNTKEQYETCRARLKALIDWHSPEVLKHD